MSGERGLEWQSRMGLEVGKSPLVALEAQVGPSPEGQSRSEQPFQPSGLGGAHSAPGELEASVGQELAGQHLGQV